MKVDKEWVENNFDIIDKIFSRLNKEETTANKSYHRKKMKEDMDKPAYRGYYELARKQEKEKVNKAKTIGDKQERTRMDEIMEANASNTQNAISNADEAIDLLDDEIREKNKLINSLTNLMSEKDAQMREKDKQIESLLQLLSQK